MVQIIRETTQNGSPAPQTEGSSKAQIGQDFAVIDFPVRTLAAFIRASRQSLDDIEGLMSFINTQLPQEILSLEDTQLLTGNGTAPNLQGVITAAGSSNNNTFLGGDLPSPQLWDVIARIMGGMLAKNEPVDFVLLNPTDFAAMLTAKGSNGQYVAPLIFDNGQPFVYGLPVFVNSAIAADTILVGNSLMAQPTFREGLNISLSYEDGTNFRDNMVTIRAEERLANVIYRPNAFFTGSISTIISDHLLP
jgi:HK97 family phage major capsid protein